MSIDTISELKSKLIERLNLKDLNPNDIDPDAPLFGVGLGLDSIDALEIIVLLDQDYKIKFDDPEKAKSVFTSIRSIADFIDTHR